MAKRSSSLSAVSIHGIVRWAKLEAQELDDAFRARPFSYNKTVDEFLDLLNLVCELTVRMRVSDDQFDRWHAKQESRDREHCSVEQYMKAIVAAKRDEQR